MKLQFQMIIQQPGDYAFVESRPRIDRAFGRRLRWWVEKQCRLTAAQAARSCFVTTGQFSKWMNGHRPHIYMIVGIVRRLRCERQWLLHGTQDRDFKKQPPSRRKPSYLRKPPVDGGWQA